MSAWKWEYVFNGASVLPILAVAIAGSGGWKVPARYLLAAGAFGVSALADLYQWQHGGSWIVTYYYLPPQMWLLFWALMAESKASALVLPALPALTAVSFVSAWLSAPGGDWLVTLVGSVLLCITAWRRGVLVGPVLAYFGAGSAAYLAMILTWGSHAMEAWWFAYKAACVVALCWLCLSVFRERWGMPE